MFFDTNKVNNALLCKQCEGRLDIPKILPCGETICSYCEISIQVNENNMFDCLVCKDKHEMPKNGFLISKALSEILSIKLIRLFILGVSKIYNKMNAILSEKYQNDVFM